jgi:hypothetical protein
MHSGYARLPFGALRASRPFGVVSEAILVAFMPALKKLPGLVDTVTTILGPDKKRVNLKCASGQP